MLNIKIENLKVQSYYNYTLGEASYRLTGELNGIVKVIGTYETSQEALAAEHAIKSLIELTNE